mmetsp:Transcript_19912/g.36125  ORF Transcript_19912/g.36125 Transcript_19912/m.36125 type:complete len:81 (-) Transcript_19912:120-362(-)
MNQLSNSNQSICVRTANRRRIDCTHRNAKRPNGPPDSILISTNSHPIPTRRPALEPPGRAASIHPIHLQLDAINSSQKRG